MEEKEQQSSSPTAATIVKVKLQNKLSHIQLTTTSSVPTDVTLKLSDGSIGAHKVILALASPIFQEMFYEGGKEKKEAVADLPKEKCKVMQLLVDFICHGNCEIDFLDDTLPLIEAFNRYKVTVVPFKYACGEVIVPQLDSSNYLTLLPKYASVISEEGHKKAADKVMGYTNNDFVTNFDQTKDLPEEVMLPLLQNDGISVCEINILEFLIKWLGYQTKELGKSLQLVPQLFSSIRYSLIIPRLLFETISTCDYSEVGKHLNAALDYVYNNRKLPVKNDNQVRVVANIHHVMMDIYSNQFTFISETEFSASANNIQSNNNSMVMSNELANGIYAFTISNKTPLNQGSYELQPPFYILNIIDKTDQNVPLCTVKASDCSLIVIYIYDNDIFIKIKENNVVKSTYSAIGLKPFRYRVRGSGQNWYNINFHFQVQSVV